MVINIVFIHCYFGAKYKRIARRIDKYFSGTQHKNNHYLISAYLTFLEYSWLHFMSFTHY